MTQDLKVNIIGDASGLHKTLDETTTSFKGSVGEWAKGAIAFGGVSEAMSTVVDVAKDAVNAAVEDQAAQTRLNAVFAAAHIPLSQYKDSIEKAEATGRQLGFTNVESLNSMTKFVGATKNVKESMDLLSTAEDLARYKHESLQTASQVLTSTMSGNTRAARDLGIQFVASTTNVDALKEKYKALNEQVPKAALQAAQLADKQANARDVIDKVSVAVKGQADAYANTAAGAADKFHASLDNLEAILGSKILPIIATVTSAIANFVEGIQSGAGAGGEFASVISTAFDAVKLVVTDTIGAVIGWIQQNEQTFRDIGKVAQTIFNDGIVPLFQFVFDVAKKVWGGIRDYLSGVFDVIKGLVKVFSSLLQGDFSGMWDGIKQVFKGSLEAIKGEFLTFTAPFRVVAQKVFSVISDVVSGVVSSVSNAISSIPGALVGIGKAMLSAATGIGQFIIKGISAGLGAAASIFSPIAGAFKSVINTIIGWWDSLHFSIPKVDIGPIHIGGGTIGLPKIPYLASGISNFAGGLAVVGEQGPELVNLPRGASVIPAGRTAAMLGGMGRGGSDVHYHFEIGQVVANDPQTLVNQLRIWTQRNGSLAAAGVR